ncbi:Gfo/Idh/MocA family oxidoreductase [Amnibacterium sp.]|uniref:Gfo/Idh/MocA family protein n=1 Tax=Amnibacterium sp. TaxID=1872496 RepID=UPI0026124CA1|nr:Gfo/Idh/MocA family oxidoreductase [Amnibacterium sp.]MCU1475215.1 oxidoreductase [Amnibacterium sp.]
MRAGLIGGGFMGAVHARSARAAGADVVAVATSSADGARRAAESLGVPVAAESVDALLALDLDVVHVTSPNAAHLEHALAVLAAGLPVVCEKPLATSAADAARLADAAREAGIVATVPFVYRFHPMAREARDRVRSGGRVFTVQGAYLQDWLLNPDDDDWRTDPSAGGPSRAFADIGSHLADLTEFVAGERITRLLAITRTVHPERNGHPVASEDAAAVVVETASGAIGTLLVSQVAAGHDNGLVLEVATAGGAVRFEQEEPNRLWLGARGESTLLSRGGPQNGADALRLSIVPPGHPMGYLDAFAAFVRDSYAAIGGARPDGLPTFDDGLRAARLTDAVLRSAETGEWVDTSHA